jgi:outer membrane lipoprotein SlyB
MRGNSIRIVLLPVLLAAGLGACANSGVAPGYVNTASGSSTASASTYGTPTGESGRVVAINDTSLQGGGGSGNGPMVGGLLGGLGGIAIGASGGRGVGGGLIGGLLGGVAGAIGGAIFDRQTPGRGIEVTVQKDNGQTVRIAQRDDGDVQLGDRVQIFQDRNGVAKAVRDNSRAPDYNQPTQTYQPAPQDYRQANSGGTYGGNYGPPPQDYRQGSYQSGSYGGGSQDFGGPQPADYGQPQRYSRPQATSRSGYQGGGYGGYQSGGYAQSGGYQSGPQPQNDPRYGTLE